MSLQLCLPLGVLLFATACPGPQPPDNRDTTAPAQPVLTASAITESSVTVGWTAVGDDGTIGNATSQELRYATGAGCPLTQSNFTGGIKVTSLGAPKASGTAESVMVTGLTAATDYCFALLVTDDASNSALSASVSAHTTGTTPVADSSAPATPVLEVGTITANTVALSWTAVGDDGDTGTATSQELRYASGSSCPLTTDTFASATAVTGLGIPQPAGASESANVQGLSSDTAYCFMLKVSDEAGNSAWSASVSAHTPDVTAPAQPTLVASNATGNTVDLSWTAVGDDGTTGTAASQELRFATGAGCPITEANFASASIVSGVNAPQAAGTAEGVTATGLISDTDYCFVVRVSDEGGNFAQSASVAIHTLDVTAPAQPTLTVGTVTQDSVALSWTAVGDDGPTGQAASQELRYGTGALCPLSVGDFAVATAVAVSAPLPAGSAESTIVSGLTSDTTYCFALLVTDDSGNSTLSESVSASTPDVTAPAQPVLALVSATAQSITLSWTAVGDDGTTGTAATQELRSDTGAACPLTPDRFSTATAVAGLGSPQAAGSAEQVTASSLASDTPYCFMLKVADESGNASYSASFTASTQDVTAPAAVADLHTTSVTHASATFQWTAVGDNGTSGTATSYELRYITGSCPAQPFDFASGTQVTGLGAPSAAGSTESFTASGLTANSTYCFMLQVADEVGQVSLSNMAEVSTFDAGADLSAVRAAIDAASSSQVPLDLQVTHAVVSFVKPAINGALNGTADGAGLFLQGGDTGPAIYVAMDPSSFAGGVQPGDVVDVHVTEGSWLSCGGATCTGSNSLAAITQATATKTGTAALPAAQDLTNVALTLPIAGSPWDYESERVNVVGKLGALSASDGSGFQTAQLTTTGTNSALLQLRLPEVLVQSLGAAEGCTATVHGTPMWRSGNVAQAIAWSTGDVSLSGCPLPTIVATTPADGAHEVPLSPVITLTFNAPMNGSTLTVQTTSGSCSGSIQVLTNSGTCVGFQSSAVTLSADKLTATLPPLAAPMLTANTRYRIKVQSTATSNNGGAFSSTGVTQSSGFVTASPASCGGAQVVISQVFGGGGNSGAYYANDFIELHNRGSTPVDVTGWTVQYASSGSKFDFNLSNQTVLSAPAGSPPGTRVIIPAGGYFLVQGSAGKNTSAAPLPTPDVVGGLSLSGTQGKVVLATTADAMTVDPNTGCPTGANLVDYLGFNAICGEGASTTVPAGFPSLGISNTTAAMRANLGCTDTDNNGADFDIVAPMPRNSASPAATCSCAAGNNVTVNETDTAPEADVCSVHAPAAGFSVIAGDVSPSITGRVTEAGVTPIATTGAPVFAEVGYGFDGSDPRTQWVFFPAEHDTNCADCAASEDQFTHELPVPSVAGNYRYGYRFSFDATHWTYCDLDGAGSSGTLTFDPTNLPQMIVEPAPVVINTSGPNYGTGPGTNPGAQFSIHTTLGIPDTGTVDVSNPDHYLSKKPQYVTSYNSSRKNPNYTAWELNTSWLGSAPRQDTFRPDDTLSSLGLPVAQLSDFSGSGWDRGHMCPSADRTWTIADNSNTFYLSNMLPQASNNNQGAWADLENYSRTLANAGRELFIVSGGIYENTQTIGAGVAVPTKTWKVIVVLDHPGQGAADVTTSTRVIAVIMPNDDALIPINADWHNYRVKVRDIEAATGYDFNRDVPQAVQDVIENVVDTAP